MIYRNCFSTSLRTRVFDVYSGKGHIRYCGLVRGPHIKKK